MEIYKSNTTGSHKNRPISREHKSPYRPHNSNTTIIHSFNFLSTTTCKFTPFKKNNKMGSEVVVIEEKRKPKFLCLHGFRTSGHILKTQLQKWPQFVLDKLDLVFPDAPFPCTGKSDVEGIFDPPYYEWFQFNKEFTEYYNFDECIEYIQELMIKHGPVDGLLGFSQGSILSAALAGLQAKGLALTKVPKIKFLIIISGAKLKNEALAEKAFSNTVCCPSLHFLGEMDFLKPHGTTLLESFVDPVVIHHPRGHTIPRLDEKGLELMLSFLEKIQKEVTNQEEKEVTNQEEQEICLEEAH